MDRIYRIKKRQLHHEEHEGNEAKPGNAVCLTGIPGRGGRPGRPVLCSIFRVGYWILNKVLGFRF